jgi:hypothetical protein
MAQPTGATDPAADIPAVTVLATSGDRERLAAAHARLLGTRGDAGEDPAVRWLSIPAEQWRSPLAIARALARVRTGTFAIGVSGLAGRPDPVVLKAAAMLPAATRRLIVDEAGCVVALSRTGFLLLDLPRLAVRLAAAAGLVLASYALLVPLKLALRRSGRGWA